ncbi:type I restriction-modification system subunit M [Rhizobium ruizarguesonis]|uniref:type I restriction-modification system subunit M n=1 Tax=Rhizobium ruizarguesonis TaxID=2081791 RepID=UPI00102FE9D3|nr:type I restriction-modification system subunit M [Rhizobium ruizarguesonis]TCA62120.1 type I restriction-modification system subunit M [Rhizobium leguminosarum bv. viciae]TAZ81364.1 type I restriction-modification system subunit M [Rhizobium ruizarguesonis]TBA36641.1 type I restriction-modification system subunit M [Rhizobium ruizarguesonis]TBA84227.1 type I restriction-modification system subunit M [Rhizobium ruizarguesonis]TBB10350.1 type I restriction-modification system subunit M [Rhizo
MLNRITQDTINKAAWAACDTFRGTVDASIYKDYVLTMLFLKYISDVWKDHYAAYKEKHGDHPELIEAMMAQEQFVLPRSRDFDALYRDRHKPGNGERIDKALHAIEEANGDKLRDVFQDISFNANRLGDEEQKNDILRLLLEDFAKPELDMRPSRVGNLDIIGGAYEFLISKFAASAGKKAGEFYTPAEVSALMARLVEPQEGEDICDPTCGSGSLLLKCAREVRGEANRKAHYALYGQEAIGSTWALAKMNMFLHGEVNHQIEWGDTIGNPKLRTSNDMLRHFDVVVANPPFSLDKWGAEKAAKDPFGRFRRGMPPKTKGDYAFILHMVETLKPKTGRMAVVVPNGVLFRGSSEAIIRQKLIEENLLDVVIGLPEKLFFGTGIPAAILVFRKKKTDTKVLFIDASRDYIEGTNQNRLGEEQIDRVFTAYDDRTSIEKYAYLASREEIAAKDFNLNIPRYVDAFEEETEIDLMAVRAERKSLKAELDVLESQMEQYLRELSYDID